MGQQSAANLALETRRPTRLCDVRESRTNVHGPASYLMNTGSCCPLSCLGSCCLTAWVRSPTTCRRSSCCPIHADCPTTKRKFLGRLSAGEICGRRDQTRFEGTDLRSRAAAERIIHHPDGEREGREAAAELNTQYSEHNPGDSRLEARVASYELAARCKSRSGGVRPSCRIADHACDLRRQSVGHGDFGRRCLTARRLIERGVRFVQVWSGAGGPTNNWDNLTDIITELPKMTSATDQPIAGLLHDLHSRGLSKIRSSSGVRISVACRSRRAPPAVITPAGQWLPGCACGS